MLTNVSASVLTGVLQVPMGFIAENPSAWAICETLVREAVAVAAGEELAGHDAGLRRGRVGVEEVAGLAEQRVGNAGKTVGGTDAGEDRRGVVAGPVDGAMRLAHQRLERAAHGGVVGLWALRLPAAGAPLVECVGRGTGLDDAGLAHKRTLMQQALDRAQLPADADVMDILTEFGGFEIVMMVGAYLAAAEAGITILGDGVIATSALLAATCIEPHVRDYVVFCHKSAEAGHLVQLRALDAKPLLDIGMRLGEGTGAMVAYPLLCSALAFMNQMASFESAGVSQRIR